MSDKKIHVVRILNHKEIIIDAGSSESIKKENKFDVIDSDGDPIKDLNGKIIGYLPSIKATVHALDIHDHFSIIGYSKRDYVVPGMPKLINSTNVLGIASIKNSQILNVDSSQIVPRTSENSNISIKIGDEVIVR